MVGARRAEDGIGAANILKPAFARGKLQAIGAMSIAEYRNKLREIWRWRDVCDLPLSRQLEYLPVMVKEPTVKQTIGICKAIAPNI